MDGSTYTPAPAPAPAAAIPAFGPTAKGTPNSSNAFLQVDYDENGNPLPWGQKGTMKDKSSATYAVAQGRQQQLTSQASGQKQATAWARDAHDQQAPTVDTTYTDADRGMQLGVNQQQSQLGGYYQNLLAQQYNPNESLAQKQMLAGRDANIAQSMAMANSARGSMGQQAQAQHQAMVQGAAATQQTVQQAGMLRAQEENDWSNRQLQAANSYTGLLQGQRAQDLQSQTQSAQMAQYQANLQQQQQQQNNQATLGYGNLALGYAGLGEQNFDTTQGAYNQQLQINAQQAAAEKQQKNQQTAAYLQTGATIAAAAL